MTHRTITAAVFVLFGFMGLTYDATIGALPLVQKVEEVLTDKQDIVPEAPKNVETTARDWGTVSIPATEGVDYYVVHDTGRFLAPKGTFSVYSERGTFEVQAEARKGYELAPDAQREWRFTLDEVR